MEKLIIIIVVIIALVFVLRMLGAWMLRINIVIRELKTMNDLLKKTFREILKLNDQDFDN